MTEFINRSSLSFIELTHKESECVLTTFGAHVVSWKVRDHEKLWMSSLSAADGSAPIRGGIPIAFPQFADEGDIKKIHGFVRECVWKVEEKGNDYCVLSLSDSTETRAYFPYSFSLEYKIHLQSPGLNVNLRVTNTDTKTFSFTGCLHTYFRFHDTSNVYLLGLEDSVFIDKVDSRKEKVQSGPINIRDESIRSAQDAGIEHGYVDRIFPNSPKEFTFQSDGKILFKVSQSKSWPDTTIYNPWLGDKQGPKGPDFDDDGYLHTICCEPTISSHKAVVLDSGGTWSGSQTIEVVDT